jgi:hypothetical protein
MTDMGANIWFWLLYVLCVIFGLWGNNPWTGAQPWGPFANSLVVFILLGLLGFHAFGSPIR